MTIGFRATDEDEKIIAAHRREGESTTDVLRRALRLLDREAWEQRARMDMSRLRDEDLSVEPDAWNYDDDGNIRVAGTSVTVAPRKPEPDR